MCGIYGEFNFKGATSLEDSIQALNLLKHRGPDGFGIEYGNFTSNDYSIYHNALPDYDRALPSNYFLGHRRLSIVDLNDNAFQPMESTNRQYSIVFNGEIYNHIELKEELIKLGHIFNTDHSDTEVLINSYAEWGEECVTRFRGMFAFAIFDRHKQHLFFARDRIGQKTLYYELSEQHFIFSSELPSIAHFGKPRKIDHTALNSYLALGYISHPHSIFESIKKLPPATYGTFDLQNKILTLKEYWDLDFAENTGASHEFVTAAKDKLAESVSYRLRADVSVGAFISGGTDSTLIVKNISEISNDHFDIYGADFPNTTRSEKKYIEEAARRYQQNLNLSAIDISKIHNIESIVKVFDEPFDGASSIALFDLFKEASKKHKVILTGDGGDEMFAGYTHHISFPKFERKIQLLKKFILPKKILDLLVACRIKSNKLLMLRAAFHNNSLQNFFGLNTPYDSSALLKREYKINDLANIETFAKVQLALTKKLISPAKALQYLELKTILPGRMLYKLDRFSMFYSVEARSPFLDHKLAELAFRIPESENLANNRTKAILKKILLEDFDDAFVHRKKQGFGNPLSNWFKQSDQYHIFSALLNKNHPVFNYLDYQKTHSRFPELKNGYQGENEKEIWRLLVLAHYLKNNQHLFQNQ